MNSKILRLWPALLLGALVLVVGCNSGVSGAAPDARLVGSWDGQVVTGSGKLVGVELTVAPGARALELDYGGNRACTLEGKYAGNLNGKEVYSLESNNGGSFCDAAEEMQLSVVGKGLHYLIRFTDQADESGDLERR